MKNVWFISGLGADERAFFKLDFREWQPHFVFWMPPKEKETLPEYAKRLSEQITEENPIIIGYSFGGMLAVEIAKIRKVKKVILLSSAKVDKELPPHYRAVRKMPFLWKIISPWWIKKTRWIVYKMFQPAPGYERDLLTKFMNESDPKFLIWAMRAIVEWHNDFIPENTIHIHGTKDKVLPFKFVNADIAIQKANHLMAVNRHEELSKILHNLIDD